MLLIFRNETKNWSLHSNNDFTKYLSMKKMYLKTALTICVILMCLNAKAELTITPREGKPGKLIKLSIKSNNGPITRDSTCFKTNSDCNYIGNYLYYGYSPEVMNQKLGIQNFVLVTPDSAEFFVKLPTNSQSYYLSTFNNYGFLGTFRVGDPYKRFTITPNSGYSGQELKVTITGDNTNIGQGNTCDNDTNCSAIGPLFYFSSGSTTVDGSFPIKSYKQIDEKNAELTIELPAINSSYYYLNTLNQPVYSNYTSGAFSSTRFDILPQYFEIIAPNLYEYNTYRIKLKGLYTKIGKGSECGSDPKCKIISDTLTYTANSINPTVNILGNIILQNYVQIDEYNAEATITLPKSGNYLLRSKSGLTGRINVISPSYTISPMTVKANTSSRLVISSKGIKIGNTDECKNNPINCKPIGNSILFAFSGSSTLSIKEIPIEQLEIIDDNNIAINATFPQEGNYNNLITSTGLNLGYVRAVPPSFDVLAPTTWQENVPMTVTITGNLTNIGKGTLCANDPNCTEIGDSIYFSNSSYFKTIVGQQKITSYQQINDTTIVITFLAPSKGNYYLANGKGIISNNLIMTEASTAQMYGSSTLCKLSKVDAYISFTGNPPWDIKYTNGAEIFELRDIKEKQITLTFNPTKNTSYQLVEVSNPHGLASLSGSANFTVNTDTAASASLSRIDSASSNEFLKLRIDLKGKSPWHVYFNGGGVDSLINIYNNPYIFTLRPIAYTTYKVSNVYDASNCGFGLSTGSVVYAPGDIITRLDTEKESASVNVFPNPTSGILNLEGSTDATLFSLLGDEILNTGNNKLDLTSLPSGLYFLRVKDLRSQIKLFKIIKE